MTHPHIDDRDWSTLTRSERVRQIEVEGYLLLPDLLSTEDIAALKAQSTQFETIPVDYSPHQLTRQNIQFEGGSVTELIGHPVTIGFLAELFGDDIILMSYSYSRSEPGHPGISLHTDGQPYGSEIFGYEGSCPFAVRVLYYLDDLTREVSPSRGSHGHGEGRVGSVDQSQGIPRKLSQHRQSSERDVGDLLSSGLGRAGCRCGRMGFCRSTKTARLGAPLLSRPQLTRMGFSRR